MASDETPRRGSLTEAQRAELRRILDDEYRGVFRHGEALILDGFIADLKPTTRAAIEFDFVPDPNANPQTPPQEGRDYFILDLKPDPAAAFVGLLMANPTLAADVLGFVREDLETKMACGMGHDEREVRIADALARLDNLKGWQ